MENAAKALLIAGEVLIGIIILGILSLVFRRAMLVRESYQERLEQQSVNAFNVQFQQYLTYEYSETKADGTITQHIKLLNSEDVVSLIRKVEDWNKDEGHNIIKLIVKLQNGAQIKVERKITMTDENARIKEFSEKDFLVTYKLKGNTNITPAEEYKFTCEMTYNGENGKVDTITVKIRNN